MKTCKNCAWYCHIDGKCWGNKMNIGLEIFIPAGDGYCKDWSYDGLDDWEREQIVEPSNTLMTMK